MTGQTVKALLLDKFGGVGSFAPLRRRFIDNKERGRIPGHFQKIGQFGHCFECKQVWLNRGQNHIGAASCLGCICGGMRRRINHDEIDALTLSRLMQKSP